MHKIPSIAKYELHFVFRTKYPPWFHFGYKFIQNALKLEKQRVTWTKFGLHNYPKTLHYGIHQVRVERLDTDVLAVADASSGLSKRVEDPNSSVNNSSNTPLSPVSQKSKSNNFNKGLESANSSPGGDKVKISPLSQNQNILKLLIN